MQRRNEMPASLALSTACFNPFEPRARANASALILLAAPAEAVGGKEAIRTWERAYMDAIFSDSQTLISDW